MIYSGDPLSKKFPKKGLDTQRRSALQGVLIARAIHKTVYFRYVTGLSMFLSTCITWGKSPEIPRMTRLSGYPHLWRTMWITPTPLWKRAAGFPVSSELDISST
jgi:hypothetical protein